MPRFVILRHEMPPGHERPSHWDLMLETGAVLRTWALAEAPRGGAGIAASELTPHRPHYLDFEGPLSGNRGTVVRWDAGVYTIPAETAQELHVVFAGQRIVGPAVLRQTAGHPAQWVFNLLEPDTAAP